MSEINNSGPAFPCVEEGGRIGYVVHHGMTLRDYFAANALGGYMATNFPAEGLKMVSMDENDRAIAEHCYAIADAMLKAREGGAV